MGSGITLKETDPAAIETPATGKSTLFLDATAVPPAPAFKDDAGVVHALEGLGITALTGDVAAGPGSGSQAATIPANTITYAKLQDVSAASKLLGRGSASGSGDAEEISLGTGLAMTGTTLSSSVTGGITTLTGDVTAGPGSGSQAATIPANTVTYAKLQDVSAASKLLGRGSASGSGDAEEITLGTGLTMTGTTLAAAAAAGRLLFGFVIDGGGATITTGLKGYLRVPVACTITKWTILSIDTTGPATAGSIVIDIWKDTFTNYPPNVADTITASAKPTLSSANKAESATLTGWTTSVSAGDTFGFNVDSVTTLTKVLIEVEASVP